MSTRTAQHLDAEPAPALDESAVEERRRQVEASAHSIRLEGGEVSPEWWQESEQYIAGKITADDLVNLARQRYGLPPQ